MNRYLAELTNPVLPTNLGSGSISQGGTVIGKLISSIGGLFFIFALLSFIFSRVVYRGLLQEEINQNWS